MAGLTDTDRQMLTLVGEGLTDKEIAKRLNYSYGTVRNRLNYLRARHYKVPGRAPLVLAAIAHGDIDLGVRDRLPFLVVEAERLVALLHSLVDEITRERTA